MVSDHLQTISGDTQLALASGGPSILKPIEEVAESDQGGAEQKERNLHKDSEISDWDIRSDSLVHSERGLLQ